MTWPWIWVLMSTFSMGSTFPMARMVTGTSFCSTVATVTGTAGGGPLAAAFSCFEQPAIRKRDESSKKVVLRTNKRMFVSKTTGEPAEVAHQANSYGCAYESRDSQV